MFQTTAGVVSVVCTDFTNIQHDQMHDESVLSSNPYTRDYKQYNQSPFKIILSWISSVMQQKLCTKSEKSTKNSDLLLTT